MAGATPVWPVPKIKLLSCAKTSPGMLQLPFAPSARKEGASVPFTPTRLHQTQINVTRLLLDLLQDQCQGPSTGLSGREESSTPEQLGHPRPPVRDWDGEESLREGEEGVKSSALRAPPHPPLASLLTLGGRE